MMTISEVKKWLAVAKGLERVGLLKSSDWKSVRLISKTYRTELVNKVIDKAAQIGSAC